MLAENRKARFDYDEIASYEAGVVLSGAEVKSVRGGGVNMTGARVIFDGGEAFVIGLHINKYGFDSNEAFDPIRRKKLLLRRHEILEIEQKMKSSGLTVVPISVYNKGSLVKVKIALVRGRRKFEKRELIKKRETQQDIARRLKLN